MKAPIILFYSAHAYAICMKAQEWECKDVVLSTAGKASCNTIAFPDDVLNG